LLRQLSGFESRHISKIQNGRKLQRSGQHTPARQQIYKKRKKKKRNRETREGGFFFLTVHFQFMCPLSIYVSPSPNNLPWAGSRAGPPVSEYVSPVRKNYLEVCTRTKLRCLHSWEWDYTISHMRIITHFFGT